ncbi:SRPBCC family protein [Saccharibacillus sp. CPCC 101409]|uniref:SRPBCC family protein n=1 Tax=Saccharibacillus sp. CPCC 101409 TaxID=3058041 RepID=UPI002673537A|nr:SRPBCC family protein [Saccharibacillus sp. CPCC 101409]MDO3411614.1 SRPBCC family protein [Saccharibacillus sp. CPCC 101409]
MDLEYEIYVDAPAEKVWEALVTPEGTKACFFGTELRSSLEPGAPFEYVGPGNDGDETVHVHGEIIAAEPNRKLSYTEQAGPSYIKDEAPKPTRVTFTLEPAGSCTKLTLVNDRLGENHPSQEQTKSAWPMMLSSLKTWCETGKTLDLGW